MLVMGIDLGTGGVRSIAADEHGKVWGQCAVPFADTATAPRADGRFVQDPTEWRRGLTSSMEGALDQLRARGGDVSAVEAISVTSTSGTLCLVDDAGEPVCDAIMYSDGRAGAEAEEANTAGRELVERLGTRISASWALPRLTWLARHQPDVLARARWAMSPTDLVIGWLSGVWGRSDWTNALKWAYDVVRLEWPAFIPQLGVDPRLLPTVDAPGSVIGTLRGAVADELGLASDTMVVSGATDGNASQFASGAVRPGDWNSTLGTTLVLKGVATQLLKDPLGRVYCHRHPEGLGDDVWWLPGGASSTGADCLAQRFSPDDLGRLNALAAQSGPTDLVVYPLARRGERFPFYAPDAEGFLLGDAPDEETRYRAHLEGLAYVERLAFETVEALGADVGDTIYAVGGATRSDASLQIRADVLGKRLAVPEVPIGAMGAAVLAARARGFVSVAEAARAMVRIASVIEPQRSLAAAYGERYRRFVDECRRRGYLP